MFTLHYAKYCHIHYLILTQMCTRLCRCYSPRLTDGETGSDRFCDLPKITLCELTMDPDFLIPSMLHTCPHQILFLNSDKHLKADLGATFFHCGTWKVNWFTRESKQWQWPGAHEPAGSLSGWRRNWTERRAQGRKENCVFTTHLWHWEYSNQWDPEENKWNQKRENHSDPGS